jgi:ParB-like chromosome segregation protein Spo0J
MMRVINPRTHSDQKIAQIAASIQEFGWTNQSWLGLTK